MLCSYTPCATSWTLTSSVCVQVCSLIRITLGHVHLAWRRIWCNIRPQLAKYLKTAGCVTGGTDSHNYIVERFVADLTMTTERDDGVESALCRTRSHRCHMLFELRLAVLCRACLHTSRFLLFQWHVTKKAKSACSGPFSG